MDQKTRKWTDGTTSLALKNEYATSPLLTSPKVNWRLLKGIIFLHLNSGDVKGKLQSKDTPFKFRSYFLHSLVSLDKVGLGQVQSMDNHRRLQFDEVKTVQMDSYLAIKITDAEKCPHSVF